MSQAVVRTNPDESLVQVVFPDGSASDVLEPEDDHIIFSDPDQPGESFVLMLDDYEGLKGGTLYRLVEVATMAETDQDLEQETEDEPGEGQPA